MSALTATIRLDPDIDKAAISGRSTKTECRLEDAGRDRQRGSERISTKLAVSIATSVPAPIATPRSAWTRARASLTPSPPSCPSHGTAYSPSAPVERARPNRCSAAIYTWESGNATTDRKRIGTSTRSTGPWAPSPSICSESPGCSRYTDRLWL